MLTKARVAVVAVIVLGAASTSQARDGSGPPTIDIQKTCRENVNALREIGQNESICLMDEQDARDQLVKDWASYPSIAKARCVQPKGYLSGYVEWQSCLELTRELLRMRKESASGASESSAGRRPKGRRAGAVKGECPVAKYTEDGSIDYVINCQGGMGL
jgi:hypothetical protein